MIDIGHKSNKTAIIDILDNPFENDTFVLIIANSMLYHVKDIDQTIAEVRRVLKKGGLFFALRWA